MSAGLATASHSTEVRFQDLWSPLRELPLLAAIANRGQGRIKMKLVVRSGKI